MDKKLTSAVYAAVEKAYDHRCDIEDAADEILEIIKADRKRRGSIVNNASASSEPVKVNAIFETQDGEVIGTTDAKVNRVEWQDDGSLTVIIDHWPQSDKPMRCKGCGYLVTDMEHQICVKAAQLIEPESCFCDRMYPDSNPDASCGDCPIRDYGAKAAEPVKNTCKKCNGTGVESTQFHGVWPNGEECLEPIKCDQCDGFGTTSAAEPVSKTDWNNELSSWSDEDFIRIFHERPDLANRLRKMLAEPGKVDAKASVPSDESTRKWKRIEEYSREVDGKKIDIYLGDFLLYCPELEDEENSGVVIGYYSESYRGWYTSDEKVFPTHFMPLPEKP